MPLPNWVMLEPFVSRRYGDDSFPDESRAPIRASGTTSWGATFTIAFSLAKPPRISRLYAQLPQFTYPSVYTPLTIVATHRHLSLFEVVDQTSTTMVPLQDLFLYSADKTENPTSSLRALPPCTEPKFDYFRSDGRLSHHPSSAPPKRRPLTTRHMGLLCRGEEEFAVAQLNLYRPSRTKVFADICLLRPCSPPALGPGDQLVGGRWKNMRLDVLCSDTDTDSHDDLLYFWDTDTIIPFQKWLCWIDYYRGILFCDLFRDPNPSVSFLRLPLDEFPSDNIRINTRSSFYRGAFVVDNGRALKFVNIARHDGIPLGALKPGTGFTITCHTLLMSHDAGGGMAWKVDYQVTSDELWRANHPDRLPRDILMHPQVDIDRPHVVHFLYIQWGCAQKKMWVVSIDMSTKIVESYYLYINGWEGLRTDNEDLIRHKSMAPMPFLPCEFPKFLHLSRTSKGME